MIWTVTLIASPILTALYMIMTRREYNFSQQSKWENALIAGCFFLAWSFFTFFASIMVNCTFDNQKSHFVKSSITKKSSNSRKSGRDFYADVQLPEKYQRTESVLMPKNRWNDLHVGQDVDIEIRSGLLGAEWLVLYQP